MTSGNKILVLAAGKGVRMSELTDKTPKPLVHVGEHPFIYHVFDRIKKAGFDDIALVLGYKKEMIKKWVSENIDMPVTFLEQKEQKGTADAISCAKHWAAEDFTVVMGDNLYSQRDMKNVSSSPYPCIAGIHSEAPENFGVLVSEHGYLSRIVEKPKEHIGNIINTGLYKLPPEIFDIISSLSPSERGEYEITDALTLLASREKVKVYKIQDYWINFGSSEDIEKVRKFVEG